MADQLMHIEKSTKGRDLSPITDDLWKIFYRQLFRAESVDVVISRMKQKNVVFKWRKIYEEKAKERDEAQQKIVEKFRQRYAEDLAKSSTKPTSTEPVSSWGHHQQSEPQLAAEPKFETDS